MVELLTGHLDLCSKFENWSEKLIYRLYLMIKTDKYTFAYDNKTNNWFVISNNSDKYKFYGKIKKEKKSEKLKIVVK